MSPSPVSDLSGCRDSVSATKWQASMLSCNLPFLLFFCLSLLLSAYIFVGLFCPSRWPWDVPTQLIVLHLFRAFNRKFDASWENTRIFGSRKICSSCSTYLILLYLGSWSLRVDLWLLYFSWVLVADLCCILLWHPDTLVTTGQALMACRQHLTLNHHSYTTLMNYRCITYFSDPPVPFPSYIVNTFTCDGQTTRHLRRLCLFKHKATMSCSLAWKNRTLVSVRLDS